MTRASEQRSAPEASTSRSRGIALVAVLWVVSLLAAIAASFVMTMRTETVVARNLIDNAEARALADAGFHRAVLALASEGEALRRDGSPREREVEVSGTGFCSDARAIGAA